MVRSTTSRETFCVRQNKEAAVTRTAINARTKKQINQRRCKIKHVEHLRKEEVTTIWKGWALKCSSAAVQPHRTLSSGRTLEKHEETSKKVVQKLAESRKWKNKVVARLVDHQKWIEVQADRWLLLFLASVEDWKRSKTPNTTLNTFKHCSKLPKSVLPLWNIQTQMRKK